MINILGDIYPQDKTPNWNKILTKYDNLKLHLYEKKAATSKRKMGHITIIGNNLNKLLSEAHNIKQELLE